MSRKKTGNKATETVKEAPLQRKTEYRTEADAGDSPSPATVTEQVSLILGPQFPIL